MLAKKQTPGRRLRPLRVTELLEPDADEVLLSLLARDGCEFVHYGAGWRIDGADWWAREQQQNPLPWRVYIAAKEKAEAQRRAREAVLLEQSREFHRLAYEKRRREIDGTDRESEQFAEQFWTAYRADWIALLKQTANSLCGTHYASLIPDLERDMATLQGLPSGALPWRLNRDIFNATLQRLQREIDAASSTHTELTAAEKLS